MLGMPITGLQFWDLSKGVSDHNIWIRSAKQILSNVEIWGDLTSSRLHTSDEVITKRVESQQNTYMCV